MCEAIRKKLNSRRGVSILIALLLFLVCATLGSVMLAAATAASGRASALVENDRRYYAVTSAAELFREALDGQGLTVTRRKTAEYDLAWTAGASEKERTNESDAFTFKLGERELTAGALAEEDLISAATLDYVLGAGRTLASDAANLTHTPGSGCTWMSAKVITVSPGAGVDSIPVTATVNMADGVLILCFENAAGDTGEGQYRLSFTLTPSYEPIMEPQTYTEEGELQVTVSAGASGTVTAFTQHVTEVRDTSVHVTWRASAIGTEAGA